MFPSHHSLRFTGANAPATLAATNKTIRICSRWRAKKVLGKVSTDPMLTLPRSSRNWCSTERDLAVSLLNRDTQMSRRVKGALRRMEDGTYGTCLACEEPISVKRLQAVPWAELCLHCQERSDLTAAGALGADHEEGVELGVR